jgi:hypothetical protein
MAAMLRKIVIDCNDPQVVADLPGAPPARAGQA